jgi:hypothetical protein
MTALPGNQHFLPSMILHRHHVVVEPCDVLQTVFIWIIGKSAGFGLRWSGRGADHGHICKFTDNLGRMGALWPDATLQEAASARDLPGGGH